MSPRLLFLLSAARARRPLGRGRDAHDALLAASRAAPHGSLAPVPAVVAA
jgi:hypothetical protein